MAISTTTRYQTLLLPNPLNLQAQAMVKHVSHLSRHDCYLEMCSVFLCCDYDELVPRSTHSNLTALYANATITQRRQYQAQGKLNDQIQKKCRLAYKYGQVTSIDLDVPSFTSYLIAIQHLPSVEILIYFFLVFPKQMLAL